MGTALSAFNLTATLQAFKGADPKAANDVDHAIPVECVFQGSKVFDHGGPYRDLYSKGPREAKRDPRLRASGSLIRFEIEGEAWPSEPRTAFYDMLYLRALAATPELASQARRYDGFTDIEFNPARSLNCQARSLALHTALHTANRLSEALESRQAFLAVLGRR